MVARLFTTVLALAAAVADAGSVSVYYSSGCTGQVNSYFTGSTPVYCNTQTGSSIGYTLDSACSLIFYTDRTCGNVQRRVASATRGCQNFAGTGGSWKFVC